MDTTAGAITRSGTQTVARSALEDAYVAAHLSPRRQSSSQHGENPAGIYSGGAAEDILQQGANMMAEGLV